MAEKLLAQYMVAADNHNLGNTGSSWLDPSSWGEKIGNIGRFGATSVLSGANSFYNTGAFVSSWATGLDIKQNPTDAWISSLDSDLGKYYRENQEGVDLGGFILGSIIPGLAGVKILNAGQKALVVAETKGFIGGNLSKATGLLAPNVEKYVALSAAEINASVTSLSLLNVNTTRALAAGFWQNTLEAAAFETVVQVTMFKSPVLENQDLGDIVTNVALGGFLGGVIGGAFNAAKIRGSLKEAVRQEDVARFPFIDRPTFVTATPDSDRIIQLAYDSEMAAVPVALKAADGTLINNNFAVNATLFDDKIRKNFLDTRNAINNLAGKDTELGNIVANISTPLFKDGKYLPGFSQQYFENFSGAIRISRVLKTTPEEEKMARALIKGEKPEKEVATRFVRILGEGAGSTLAEKPKILSLGDLFEGEKGVRAAVKEYGFMVDKSWDAKRLSGAKGHLEAEARYIWAHKSLKEIPDKTVILKNDIPLLERAYADGQLNIKVLDGSGPSAVVTEIQSRKQLYDLIKEVKEDVAAYHGERMLAMKKGAIEQEGGTEAIARITNTKVSYLEGVYGRETDDLFSLQSAKDQYLQNLRDRGLSVNTPEANVDPMFLPKYAKIVYEVDQNIAGQDDNILNAITYFKEKQKIYTDEAKRVVAKIAGPFSNQLPDITDRALLNANRTGSGAGLFSSENSNYGTLGSSMAWIGSVTRSMKQAFRKDVADSMEAALTKLGQNPEAAIEFESINQKVARSGQLWIRHEQDGFQYLVTKRGWKAAAEELEDGSGVLNFDDLLSAFPEDLIELKTVQAIQAVDAHIGTTGKRTWANKEIRAVQGKSHDHDPTVFRPIRPDLKRYPHFAFVVDERVTGAGHKTMIHAASEKELQALIDKVPAKFRVLTKSDSEEYFKARHEFEYQRTLNENYINSELANEGVFSNFFPKSDPQKIVDDILQQHYKEAEVLALETVRLRYEPQFNMLENFGRQYSKAETSRFASRVETLEKTADNPYFNYIKTALDISKINEYPLIFGFNKTLDEAVSKAVGAIRETFTSIKSPEQLDVINAALDKYGMKPAYYDAALQALANHTAPKGELTKFVRKANSLLSLFTLGLDPLNSLNNAIGSNILRMTELKHVMNAIQAGDGKIAGELAEIGKIKLPGTGDEILAPTKLVARAIENFWKDGSNISTALGKEGAVRGPLMQKYRDLGLIKDRAEQLKLLVDDFTLKGTETVAELNARMSKAFERAKALTEAGEKKSGNILAEEFNRFISANVMDQITDIAVRNGIMTSKEANAYINTFVNRVEGNIIASQRPLIFQGPIGQAISLFQSYQFNLIQQLFRYVAEGSRKDIAMLAGLQSTLYGIQSLPAFQFMNVHIIGQLSGNTEHRDAYDSVYGIAGRTAGDFILYGIPSNILHTNIYSRGDINPRQLTILPTTLQEIPLVQGWGKFLLSMYETFSKIKGGGNVWESILQGIEHNGISRPLAGIAQIAQAAGPDRQVYSTTNKGSIIYSHDLLHIASLSRLAGGRPMDEAVVNDAMFRVKSYEAARRSSMQSLAETVKSSMIQGNDPDEDQILRFAERYAALGGKQAGFNKWMMELYKNANVSQAEKLQQSLTNPFSYKMQLLMGGEDE